jgi:hypothetical protein
MDIAQRAGRRTVPHAVAAGTAAIAAMGRTRPRLIPRRWVAGAVGAAAYPAAARGRAGREQIRL